MVRPRTYGGMKEHKSTSRNGRELLLFPGCSRIRDSSVGFPKPTSGRIGTGAEAASQRKGRKQNLGSTNSRTVTAHPDKISGSVEARFRVRFAALVNWNGLTKQSASRTSRM